LVPEPTEKTFDKAQGPGALNRTILLFPGALLCGAITIISFGIQTAEERAFDHPYIEALVIAILIGMVMRTAWQPSELWRPGIAFSAKQLLEIAVVLLGASVSYKSIIASGYLLLAVIVATVAIVLVASFGLGRMLGLSRKLSVLIACGNSICGNSAIAAVAPVIDADADDIASSISFTAILGVLMVLGLPLLIPLLRLSATQYGILAGLTVYAVPQVLAATVPAGIISTQIGTLVKLVRVLMLGPIVVGLSLLVTRRRKRNAAAVKSVSISPIKLVPWFIIGFLMLAALRSFQLVPDPAIAPIGKTAAILTVVSMAALGLGVDVRVLSTVGGRVTAAVTLSLMLLLALAIGLIHFFD
jgi:uncharacterized integral membrane protein (TIGR00698 family)